MNMDIEDAVNTFCIFYIEKYNEYLEYEKSKQEVETKRAFSNLRA